MQDNGDFVNRGHAMGWSPVQGVLQNVRRGCTVFGNSAVEQGRDPTP